MTGGVRIDKKDYAESRQCKVTFKSREEYALSDEKLQEKSDTYKSEVKKPQRVKSDVDSDLPVSSTQNENLFAFIIANEHYDKLQNQNVGCVDYAIHDGEVFCEYCNVVLGVPVQNIFLTRDATYLNMMDVVDQMKDIADSHAGQARFIFYYAGHGFPNDAGTDSYLFPTDGTRAVPNQGYSLTTLYQRLGELDTKSVVVFLDACFSGSTRSGNMLASVRGLARSVPKKKLSGNIVVFSASSKEEPANPYHEKGHGLFTYFLLKKLKESPDITLSALSTYINEEVYKCSTSRIQKKQRPDTTFSPNMENVWRNMVLK